MLNFLTNLLKVLVLKAIKAKFIHLESTKSNKAKFYSTIKVVNYSKAVRRKWVRNVVIICYCFVLTEDYLLEIGMRKGFVSFSGWSRGRRAAAGCTLVAHQ